LHSKHGGKYIVPYMNPKKRALLTKKSIESTF
jgi:hypothetical protein